MSKKFRPPGTFIEELPAVPATISSVETSIPAFVGYSEKAQHKGQSLLLRPTRISSMEEYRRYFGGKSNIQNISVVLDDYADRGVQEIRPDKTQHYLMYDSLRLFFENGGGSCYIVSVGFYGTAPTYGDETNPNNVGLRNGLRALEAYDEPTLLLFPDAVIVEDAPGNPGFYHLQQMALQQCGQLQDRFCILDLKQNNKANHADSVKEFRNNIGISHLEFGAAYSPFLITSYVFEPDLEMFGDSIYSSNGEQVPLQELCTSPAESALLKTYSEARDESSRKAAQAKLFREHKLMAMIVLGIKKRVCTIPPSGAIAGIYAQIDRNRGVWKAPANVSMTGAAALTHDINQWEQEDMNFHQSGKSINAIRFFTGKGILVWGARTLAGNDHEWKYISVRRLYIMIRESCMDYLSTVRNEPNDANTWATVKAALENYLIVLWRKGAITGAKPEEAFFVKVGLGSTMTAIDVTEGRILVTAGVAVVRPAEFIILHLGQQMAPS